MLTSSAWYFCLRKSDIAPYCRSDVMFAHFAARRNFTHAVSITAEGNKHRWKKPNAVALGFFWSGLRGSNPPPRPWQGRALPNELNPQILWRLVARDWCLRSELNQRHGDFQSPALPTELQRQKWRPEGDSNPWPLAWQASVLTNWTTGPYVVETTGLEPVTLCL